MTFLNRSNILSKRVYVVILFLLAVLPAAAQDVQVQLLAPAIVPVNQNFRVEVKTNKEPSNLQHPNFDGLALIAGPAVSTSMSTSIVNGNITQSAEYRYTYVLKASEPGIKNIGPATVTVDGKQYNSRSVSIEFVDEGSSAGNSGQQNHQQGQGQQQQQQQPQNPSGQIASDDVILRAVIDKSRVYKGEPVKVSFVLGTRVPIGGAEGFKHPAFNGFWAQELSIDHYDWTRQTINGKVYDTKILSEYLLYPQQSGTLRIEPMELTALIQQVVPSQNRSPFDDFFGGGPRVQNVRKTLSSSAINVVVTDLPTGAPADFSGAVGNFTMAAEQPPSQVQANTSFNYVVRISGSGNLPLIQAPKLSAPTSFEQFNVKTTESLNKTVGGITGYRQFEYPLIARAEGEFTIKPVTFSYFNPSTGRYETLSSRETDLLVVADSASMRTGSNGGGIVSGITREDLRLLGEDIRFIKTGAPMLTTTSALLMGSTAYFIILFILLAVFVLLMLYLQKRIKEMRNVVAVRNKRANKVALQRLRAAEAFLKSGNQRGYYEEMLKALWGYMGDKLNIPVAILTKENVRDELSKRNISPDHINRYIELITDSEYAQYSPAEAGQMGDIYRSAVEIISKLESLIK